MTRSTIVRAVKGLDKSRSPLLFCRQNSRRNFHSSLQRYLVRPFLLADIGEGMALLAIEWRDWTLMQLQAFEKCRSFNGSSNQVHVWSNSIHYVKCSQTRLRSRFEYAGHRLKTKQLTNSRVQITSRFDGVIKKLYYEADDTAFVGKVRATLLFHNLIG